MAATTVDDVAVVSGMVHKAHMDCEAALRTASTAGTEPGALSIVVLGASGDLAKKKTFPAIFHLYRQGFLPATTRVYGYARTKLTDEVLHAKIKPYLGASPDEGPLVAEFLNMVSYISGPYDKPDGFEVLNKTLTQFEDKEGAVDGLWQGNRLFYMALPPSVYPTVATMLRSVCMSSTGWTRLVVEKPFGKDLDSAEALSSHLGALFTEEQLYRIDHYLGKELVQNLLVMRFANRVFFPLWNRSHIASVQITFKENFGTEGRGGYFDEYGYGAPVGIAAAAVALSNSLWCYLLVQRFPSPNRSQPVAACS
ncbi:hypothetical protein CBR_g18745 [Chara braunii]|uniref:glucose-6-phosphate dehydrogenase (NADP(+)) n=1 Tax=Chara braunii TaxID=69332 RepID=A0A388KWA2_CHABU|nr:hypothetical protein CBR_g18745 [Chara braunii]|eukprot:GBG74334.1 hypothetical protein CBR_g18745 [Chara braunii]